MLYGFEGGGFEMVGRCTGHCCRMISLSLDPEAIALRVAHQRLRDEQIWQHSREAKCADCPGEDAGFPGCCGRGKPPVRVARWTDQEFVAEHFIPVRMSYVDPISNRRWPDGNKPRQVYRCSKWDGATRRCTVYEDRPLFCRSYGTGGSVCDVPGCTLRTLGNYTKAEHARMRWADDGGQVGPDDEIHEAIMAAEVASIPF